MADAMNSKNVIVFLWDTLGGVVCFYTPNEDDVYYASSLFNNSLRKDNGLVVSKILLLLFASIDPFTVYAPFLFDFDMRFEAPNTLTYHDATFSAISKA